MGYRQYLTLPEVKGRKNSRYQLSHLKRSGRAGRNKQTGNRIQPQNKGELTEPENRHAGGCEVWLGVSINCMKAKWGRQDMARKLGHNKRGRKRTRNEAKSNGWTIGNRAG